mmetsp:Transcript_17527/g.61258  ORF Transcript_17527/g.61258 Transcript_17527/m.61258 type:complete len:514 (+) Transcript_17527:101-1642(+)
MSFFDYEELERLDDKSYHSGLSAIKMKAMAMKFRHKALGYKFSTTEGKLAKTSSGPLSGSLTDPLQARSPQMPREGSVQEVLGPDNIIGLKGIFWHPLCIPLVCAPLGIMSAILGWGDSWTFWLNFAALIPLAKILGDATEELAAGLHNDTVSGLLNATFGNAVEVIVAVQSIRAGLYSVVKSSLLGSVLSNILLVLGMSFLFGGLTPSKTKKGKFHSFRGNNWNKRLIGLEKEQKFPIKSALISLGMLFFACMVVVLPTLFNALPSDDEQRVLKVSRIGAWITMSAYVMYLAFQLLTHAVTLSADDRMDGGESRVNLAPDTPAQPEDVFDSKDDDDEEDEESASIDLWVALLLMSLSTLVVAINSGFLVDTIQKVAEGSGLPMGFIGVILLPIAGNACEHASALRFSMRDRPGLAIGIAVGSATQVALLVIPLSVIIGQAIDKPMDLDFGVLNVAVVTFSLLVVVIMLLDGRSNWFKGYVLCAMYVFIAALYLYIPPAFGDDDLLQVGRTTP